MLFEFSLIKIATCSNYARL